MVATLLPIKSAPINCSRFCINRLTIRARALPFFSSRSIDARDDAVRAVSLPEKKNDNRRQIRTAKSANQSAVIIARVPIPKFANPCCTRSMRTSELGKLLRNEGADLNGIDVGRDKRCADAVREDERQLPALYLLVLGHQVH